MSCADGVGHLRGERPCAGGGNVDVASVIGLARLAQVQEGCRRPRRNKKHLSGDRINQGANIAQGDVDGIAGLQGEAVGRNKARAGHQRGPVGKGGFAE